MKIVKKLENVKIVSSFSTTTTDIYNVANWTSHFKFKKFEKLFIVSHMNSALNKAISLINNQSSTCLNHPPDHISREKKTLDSIKKKVKTVNLIITKSDKRNCLVILDKCLYIKKIQNWLSESDWKLEVWPNFEI